MARYRTEHGGWQGWLIVKEDGGRKSYLTKVSKGGGEWSVDYTTARYFTEKTAEKHLLRITERR